LQRERILAKKLEGVELDLDITRQHERELEEQVMRLLRDLQDLQDLRQVDASKLDVDTVHRDGVAETEHMHRELSTARNREKNLLVQLHSVQAELSQVRERDAELCSRLVLAADSADAAGAVAEEQEQELVSLRCRFQEAEKGRLDALATSASLLQQLENLQSEHQVCLERLEESENARRNVVCQLALSEKARQDTASEAAAFCDRHSLLEGGTQSSPRCVTSRLDSMRQRIEQLQHRANQARSSALSHDVAECKQVTVKSGQMNNWQPPPLPPPSYPPDAIC
jgi:chromosome segregation ATPase